MCASVAHAVPAYPGHPGGHYSQDRHIYECGFVYATPSTWPTICKVVNTNGHSDTSGSCTTGGDNVEVCSGSIRYCANVLDRDTGIVIVFVNSGASTYNGELKIKKDCVWIAGQTAPAPGFQIHHGMINMETGGTHQEHFLGQHFTVASGDDENWSPEGKNRKPFKGRDGKFNLDNMTFLWGIDSIFDVGSSGNGTGTLNNSILAEGLHDSIHIDQGESNPAPHSTCCILGDNTEYTLVGNLIASNVTRNPVIRSSQAELVNNIFFNWDKDGRDGTIIDNDHGAVDASFRYNYWICGPTSTECDTREAITIENGTSPPSGSDFCLEGNVHENQASTEGCCVDAGDDGTPDCGDQYDCIENVSSGSCTNGGPGAPASDYVSSPETNIQTLRTNKLTNMNIGARPAEAFGGSWNAAYSAQRRILQEADAASPSCTDPDCIKDCVESSNCTDHAGGWPVVAANQAGWSYPTDPFGDDDADGWTNIEECIHHGTGCSGNASYTDAVEPETAPGGGTGGGMGDTQLFVVERGSVTFGASARTSSNVNLSQSLGADAGFCRVTNTHMACGNPTATGTGQSSRDMGILLNYVDNDTINFSKDSSADLEDCTVEYECATYVGDAGGDYEWKVRFRGNVNIADNDADTFQAVSGVSSLSKLIPIVHACTTDNGGSSQHDRALATATTTSSPSNGFDLERGDGGAADTADCSVAAVEFTGSGWDEVRTNIACTPGDGSNATGSFTAVTDVDKCMLWSAGKSNDNEQADFSFAVWFKDIDELYCRADSASTPSTFSTVSHIACATDSDLGLTVEHIDSITGSGTDHSSTGTTKSTTLGSSLSDVAQSIVHCSGTNDQSDNTYAKGWYNYEISDEDTIAWFTPGAGATVEWACSAAQLPTAQSSPDAATNALLGNRDMNKQSLSSY